LRKAFWAYVQIYLSPLPNSSHERLPVRKVYWLLPNYWAFN